MRCPNCGKEIADDSLFCEFCGKRVDKKHPLKSKCPYCSEYNDDDSLFCEYCGKSLHVKLKPFFMRPRFIIYIIILLLFGVLIGIGIMTTYIGFVRDIPQIEALNDSLKKLQVSETGIDGEPIKNVQKTDMDINRSYIKNENKEKKTEGTKAKKSSSVVKKQDNIPPIQMPTELTEPTKPVDDDDRIYEMVEENAQFPGGDEACFNWLSEHVRYPSVCQEQGVQGRVIVSFVVNKDGSIVNVKTVRSPDSNLSAEAERVVKMMPKWTPARQGNKPVRSRFTLPIMFRLN